jgi:uncharacterized protein YbjT (DUF2867 family)
MDLVVGATGFLGGEICRRLAERGHAVRALVTSTSDPTRVEQLRGLGAEIVAGDLRDPASLAAACSGAHTVVTTATAIARPRSLEEVDAAGQLHLIDAAGTAGVERFVYTSLSAGMEGDFPLRHAKRAVEARLRECGLSYTILRPTFFMDAWLSPMLGFDASNALVKIYGDGTKPISWIALDDVAEFAIQAIGSPAARNRTLELGGPDALSPLAVVRIFEEIGSREFEVQHLPADVLTAQLAGATDPKQRSFLGLMLAYAQGDAIDMTATLADLPVRLTDVRTHARGMLPALQRSSGHAIGR